MADYDFGVTQTHTGEPDWLLQNFSEASQGDLAEGRDEHGNVKLVHSYNHRKEVSFEAIVPTGVTPPSVGDKRSIGGVAYIITAATKTQSNQDYQRFSCTATRYVENGIPADASDSI